MHNYWTVNCKNSQVVTNQPVNPAAPLSWLGNAWQITPNVKCATAVRPPGASARWGPPYRRRCRTRLHLHPRHPRSIEPITRACTRQRPSASRRVYSVTPEQFSRSTASVSCSTWRGRRKKRPTDERQREQVVEASRERPTNEQRKRCSLPLLRWVRTQRPRTLWMVGPASIALEERTARATPPPQRSSCARAAHLIRHLFSPSVSFWITTRWCLN